MIPAILGTLARSQHGLISWEQAADRGVSRSRWDGAIRSGVLESTGFGVCRFLGSPATDLQRVALAVLSAGPGALASHRTATRMWGVESIKWSPLDVTVTRRQRLTGRDGVVIHRPTNIGGLRAVNRLGIPTTDPLRSLLDLGGVAPAAVASSLEHFIITRLVTPQAVADYLAEHGRQGRPGVGPLRRAVEQWLFDERPPDSVLEVHVARLLAAYDLRGWVAQVRIGRYRVDFAHRETKTILEIDGWAFHRQRGAFDADRERDSSLAAAGWLVVRMTWRQVMNTPNEVAGRLAAVLKARSRVLG